MSRPLRPHGDMSSCTHQKCPSAQKCWRYMKPPHIRQTYTNYGTNPGQNQCDSFIGITPEEEKATL